MGDDRGTRRQEETVAKAMRTRRTFLAVTGVSVGLIAGCTDSESSGDKESNEANPEKLSEVNAEKLSDDNESDAGSSNESDEPDEPDESGEANGGESDESENQTDNESDDESEEGANEDVLDHPSALNMGHSPILGPEPANSVATIIIFDDPMCPACAKFEKNAFPALKKHADAGDLSIVWRGIPVIKDWSDAMLQVLWATYERDVDAFWDLREHAFEIQGSITGEREAIDQLINTLEESTSLDTDAIRSEAEDAAYERELSLNEDAAARAGLDATPYLYLFRDGTFRTKIRGAEDHRVIENALEL